jgi:carbon storage regulator
MLHITRRKGETVVVTTPAGERIEVSVLGFQGQQVRLGVEAPAPVSIKRGEVAEPRPSLLQDAARGR